MKFHWMLPSSVACLSGLVGCADLGHPLTLHDMNGDGAISQAEYQQSQMQYNLARRQQVDEAITAHAADADHLAAQIDRLIKLLGQPGPGAPETKSLGNRNSPKNVETLAVPDPKKLKPQSKLN